jgi:hypothetical protein
MKITNLETKSGAAKGAFLHLSHPALGHKLYSGEGADPDTGELNEAAKAEKIGCHVLGTESERVRNRAKEIQKSKLKGDEETGMLFACSLVTGFTGLTGADGKPLGTSEAEKRLFFEQSDSFVEQVITFAGDRANFFGKTSEK